MFLNRLAAIMITAIIFFFPLDGQAHSQILKTTDINGIMDEMLQQHIDRPVLTPQTFANAIKHYVEQADPYDLYLLEGEARPLTRMNIKEAAKGLEAYRKGDFSSFSQVDNLLNKAIDRSRKLRQFDDAATHDIFKEAAIRMKADSNWFPQNSGFSPDEASLTSRMRDHYVEFVMGQMINFGVDRVLQHQDIIAKKFEHSLRQGERAYQLDNAIEPAERENYFATNVLKAIASSLDAHSSFFDDDEAEAMKMRLEKGFMGVGVVITEDIDGFMISDLLTDSPAIRDGSIKINDRLLKINDREIIGMDEREVERLLRSGKETDPLKLTLVHEEGKAEFTVTLTPEMLVVEQGRVDSSYEAYEDGIIGRITLYSFYEGPKGVNSANDIAKAIEDLKQKGDLKGLILDLRGNSGGYLTQAVKVAGLFISNGVVVMSKYNNGEEHFYRDVDGSKAYDGPLVILTSRLTASAAEIVAQTLQDYGLAVVVGDEQTYGKGTIQAQTVTESNSGTYFKVTVGKYYTVSGNTTQIKGVRADIVLPGPYSQMEIGESYLGTSIGNDSIPAAFSDGLQDIEPRAKKWYTEHYIPTLQSKETKWQALLPELKMRSAKRIQSEAQYQKFLHLISSKDGSFNELGQFDIDAYQIEEATRIVADMIQMSAQQAASTIPQRVGVSQSP